MVLREASSWAHTPESCFLSSCSQPEEGWGLALSVLLREVGVAVSGPPPPPPPSPGQNCRTPVCIPVCLWAPEQFSECSCGQCVLSWRGVEAFLRELPAQNCFSFFSAGVVLMTKKALSQIFLSRVFFFPTSPLIFSSIQAPSWRTVIIILLWETLWRGAN